MNKKTSLKSSSPGLSLPLVVASFFYTPKVQQLEPMINFRGVYKVGPLQCINEQRTKPITSAKGRGWNGHRFLCVPHRSWGFNRCNKIRQTCVSKVIVFCLTPIVPESFVIVSSINVLVWLFQIVGGFGGRSNGVMTPRNGPING